MGDLVNAVADVFGVGPASKQAKATKAAAAESAAASKYASDLQQQMFERQVGLQEPWRQSGIAAQNRLLTLLGIAPEGADYSGVGSSGGFGIAGSIANAIAQSGVTGPRLQVNPNDPNFGRYAKEFGMQQFQQDPGYAFRLSEGMKALERSAAARGGLLSGATMKGLQRYGQDLASQEYQNAFARYQAERQAALNPLQSLAGIGQTSTNALGSAAGTYGANVGNLAMTNAANQGNLALAQGNIRASQYGTAGSALNTALNTDWNALGRRFGFGGSGGMQAGGQVNPVSGEYMGSLEF